MTSETRLVAPTGGRFWWAALAAVWTASTLSGAAMVHDDADQLLQLGPLRSVVPAAIALPVVAKWISVAASAAALVMIGALGRPSSTSRRHVLLGLAIALTFAAPTSILWLQDGTATGPLVAAAVACAWALDRWLGAAALSERVLVLGVAAAVPALLSIEAAPIGIATLLAARALDRTGWWPAVATTIAILLPIAAGLYVRDGGAAFATAVDLPRVELLRDARWLNPWWLVAPALLVPVAARRDRLAALGIFALVTVFVSALASDPRALLPSLAFAAAIALVHERHSGSLARALERLATRRAWRIALVIGVAHVVVTWPDVRTRFATAAVALPVADTVATLPH